MLNIPTASMPGHDHLCPPPECVPWLRTWETLMTAPQRHLANYAPSAMLFNGEGIPQNCPLPRGDPDPCLIHGYLGPPHATRHLDRASRLFEAHGPLSLYFTMGRPLPHPKIAPYMGDPDPHLIHGYLGPPHPTCQTTSRSVQPLSLIHI